VRRLADFAIDRPRRVLLGWLAICALALVPAGGLQDEVSNGGYGVPGSQSGEATRLLGSSFAGGDRQTVLVVVSGQEGRGPSARALRLRQGLRSDPGLEGVAVGRVSVRGDTALVPLLAPGSLAEVQRDVAGYRRAVQEVEPGAQLVGQAAAWDESTRVSAEDLSRSEALALPLSAAVLLIAFVSIVAAGLPVVLALVSLVVTFGALALLASVSETSVYVTNTASILGLGLAIDYSLFLVTRYRELRAEGLEERAALREMLATTGRAILFSGLTIALALTSLFVLGIGVFSSMAIGAGVAALIAATGALTVIPALIRVLGPRIDRWSLKPASRAVASGRLWRAVAAAVNRRPLPIALGSCLLLLLCALPLTGVRLDFSNSDALLPAGNSVQEAGEAVEADFGAGALSPIEVVATGRPGPVLRQLRETRGIASASIAGPAAGGWHRFTATATVGGNTEAADRVVEALRRRFANDPRTASATVYVGGETAQGMDLIERIEERIPWMVLTACALSFLLLLAAFRSLLIPAKAILTNLLSVGATLGLVALLFEGLGGAEGIAWFVPPFLFAIVFGLSMDYEVFLLSRIYEEHLNGRSNAEAIAQGLIRNGRPITLAATVMMIVFLALGLSQLEAFRQLGVGMAIAVLLDATLVRCLLVPSTLTLLGDRNWWLPGSLRRVFPAVGRGAEAP
jgi:RND superfamily putative drug exporter